MDLLQNFEYFFQMVSSRFKAQIDSNSRLEEQKELNKEHIKHLQEKLDLAVRQYENLQYCEKEEKLR